MEWRHRHTVIALVWAAVTLAGRPIPGSAAGAFVQVLVTVGAAFAFTYLLAAVWQRGVRWYRTDTTDEDGT